LLRGLVVLGGAHSFGPFSCGGRRGGHDVTAIGCGRGPRRLGLLGASGASSALGWDAPSVHLSSGSPTPAANRVS
jgi:hypothetical protein